MRQDTRVPSQAIGIKRHTFMRFTLTLLVVCVMITVWGCAGRSGTSLTLLRCPDSVQTKLTAAKSTVTVSYTEPSITVAGGALAELARTTIYYDLGSGRKLAKEIPATKPTGGGQISETITVPIQTQGEQSVRICVTATDRRGNESSMTP